MINKFRVFNYESYPVFTHSELLKIVAFLRTQDLEQNSFWVEDVEDHIQVTADELVSCFDSGEMPEDLQFF